MFSDLYMSINEHIYLEVVVVFAERIQHCFSNLSQATSLITTDCQRYRYTVELLTEAPSFF